MAYHEPALFEETLEGLVTRRKGAYVDATFGGGGHSQGILNRLDDAGRLYAFDQDEDVKGHLIKDSRFTFFDVNFKYVKNMLRMHGVKLIDGILADLGVSFHQFDTAERGFSLRYDAELDMRMGKGVERTAKDILNEYSVEDLARIFRLYGELKGAGKIASRIVAARTEEPLERIADLLKAVEGLYPERMRHKFLAKLFQAIRIEVNDELEALKSLLSQSVDLLSTGGRIAIISYHSLEDRLVKNFFRSGNLQGEVEKDFYGNPLVPFKVITRKPILPSEEEIQKNNRARSAKLRIAERI